MARELHRVTQHGRPDVNNDVQAVVVGSLDPGGVDLLGDEKVIGGGYEDRDESVRGGQSREKR